MADRSNHKGRGALPGWHWDDSSADAYTASFAGDSESRRDADGSTSLAARPSHLSLGYRLRVRFISAWCGVGAFVLTGFELIKR